MERKVSSWSIGKSRTTPGGLDGRNKTLWFPTGMDLGATVRAGVYNSGVNRRTMEL